MNSEQLRQRILAHSKTRQTKWGPQYVGCNCRRCVNDRANMAHQRMLKLMGPNYQDALR